jgi:hypothetical protein
VQPGTASSPHPCEGRGKSSAVRVRHAAQDRQQVERTAELQDPEVRAELDWRVHECERECSTGGQLGSIPQACARARQQATHEQVEGQGCGSKIGAAPEDATRHGGPAGGYAGVPTVFLPHTCVSKGGLARE